MRRLAAPLVLGVLLGTAGQVGAQDPDCRRLVEVLPATRFAKGTHQLQLAAPAAPGAQWFLSVMREGQGVLSRIELDGQVVVRPADLAGQDGRLVRVMVPLQPVSALKVRVIGHSALTVSVEGIVPEAELPPGTGRRVGQVRLFERLFAGRIPSQRETVSVPVPGTEGLFTLSLAQGAVPALTAQPEWNGQRVLGVLPLRPGVASAASPVPVLPTNGLDVRVLGLPGSSVVARLDAWLVDEVPPAVAWVTPPEGAALTDPATPLRFDFSDAHTGVASVVVLLDGVQDVSAAFTLLGGSASATLGALPALSGGAHTLEARVRDRACNETSLTLGFSVGAGDTTPPVLTTPGHLLVEQTSPDGAVATFAVSAVDDQDPAPVVTCVPASGSLFPPGPTTVVCTARDASGNERSQSFVVTVRDTLPPTLALTPAEGVLVPGPEVLLRADYADAGAGVATGSLVATVDSQDVTAQLAIGAARAEVTLTLGAGAHTFAVQVADAAGNPAQASVTFQVQGQDATPVALELTIGPAARRHAVPDETPLLQLAPGPRAIDGSDHDPGTQEGTPGARLLRLAGPAYADGVSALAGPGRSPARAISNAVHAQTSPRPNARRATDYLFLWGQFLDHDLSLTMSHTPSEPAPIPVPAGDPFFDPLGTGTVTISFLRSLYDPASSPREQLNELTAWIDGSMVYGSDAARAAALRTNDGTGRLKTSPGPDGDLLPLNSGGLDNAPTPFDPSFFVAGDVRANEQVGLAAVHTLFVREHNRLAGLLRARFPQASGEELYQAARRLVIAEIQAITYQEFLPVLLGPDALGPYQGHDPALVVGIFNEFSTAAFRLGHSLLSPTLLRLDAQGNPIPQGALPLQQAFFAPQRLTDEGGIAPLLRGAARQVCQELDPLVVDGVRNFLFGQPLDLPSLNLQRGRDHGLPAYNEVRRQLGLPARASFAEVTSDPARQAALASVYASVEEIDLWTGGLCEDQLPGAMVGEVFHAILRRQFQLLRDGDPFFYRRDFAGPALAVLESTRLSDLIRRNTTIGPELQDDVFTGPLLPASAHDLTIRAVTASGATATGFSGFLAVSASDGKPPLDGLVLEITPADQGQVSAPGLAFFQTVGTVVVTARSVPVDPGDLLLTGSLVVQVNVDAPVFYPPPPASVDPGEQLVVAGFSFPGQLVELLVDGELVASTIAGPGGAFTLSAALPSGSRQVQTRAVDPASGQARVSPLVVVQVLPPATVALEVAPASATLAVGQTLQAAASQRFVDGAVLEATTRVSWESLSPAVAAVDAAGLVRGVGVGSATIRATLDAPGGPFLAQLSVSVGVPVLVESSPFPNEPSVAVTRETILRFSAPLDPASVTAQAIHADFAGQGLPGRLHVSPDRKTVTLFYSPHLPASSRVRVTVDGGLLRDGLGNQIDADRDGQPGGVARIDFDTLSLTAGPAGTAVCGRVFASELATVGTGSINVPLEGVKISVEGAEETFFTFTDALGDFRMEPAPAGKFFVLVDGRTASNGVPLNAYYPAVGKQWESRPGEEVNVGTTYLPLVQPGTLQPVSQTEDTTLTFTEDVLRDFPQLQGTQIVVPADALYADDGTRGGSVGIAPVPPDRLPGQLPGDLPFPLVITVQTDGATNFDRPIPVRFPNLTNLPPGAKAALWSFNHDTGQWEVVGGMTVSADGLYVETDPGVGILAPGWHSWLAGVLAFFEGVLPPELYELIFGTPTGAGGEPVVDGDRCVYVTCEFPPCGSVLLHSGEERLSRTDLVIPGRGELHFAMRRTYRSQFDYDGPLGFGWSYDFDEKLRVEPNGDVTRMTGEMHLDRWVRQPDGSFTPPRGFFSRLTQRVDGVYELRETDGMLRLYSPQGALFCWVDRFGHQMGFERDERGNVDFVIDPYGRLIDFQWEEFADGKRRLTRIRDFAGREVLYAYDQEGDLREVRSPVVVGTSTGNDQPAGRTERYTYSSGFADPRLNHNLLTVTAPEEAASGGAPRLTIVYGTDPGDPMTFDKVVARTEGGVNASGVAAGGTTTFEYAAQNEGVAPGDKNLPRGRARITTPNGNVLEYFVNEDFQHVMERTYTRGLRPGEPAFYETRNEFNTDNLITRRVLPEGNEVRFVYQAGPRSGQKNVIERRLIAGPRGADGRGAPAEDLVTTYSYEPLYNRLLTVTDPRGNAPGYVPPLGSNAAGRYTRRFYYDYQEHEDPVPQAVALGIDLSGVPRGLGDLNGDGRVDQSFGNVVRADAPAVTLDPASHEAARLGGTTQTIVSQTWWNDRGQVVRTIDPEGNVVTLEYHPERDPDGDLVASVTPWRVVTSDPSGYLAAVTVDAALSPRRSAAAPPAQLTTRYRYDAVGNLVRVTNPRGVTSELEVNALNEVVVATRGADVAEAALSGQLLGAEQPVRYRTRFTHDLNGRVVLVEVEDRDSTSEGLGGFVERSTVYDLLDQPLEVTAEVDAVTRLTTRFRYDPNQNLVEVIAPEGNRVLTTWDERDLPFTITRGAGTPEESTVQLDYDLNGNRVRLTDAEDTDGDGAREATTWVLDGFDRPVEVVDALGNRALTSFDVVSNVVRSRVLGHPAGAPAGAPVLLADTRFAHDELNRVFRTDAELFLAGGFAPARPVSLLDQDGDGKVTTRLEWDALSRPTFVVEDDLEVSRTVYDGASRALESVDALGNRAQRVFDRNGNVVLATAVEVSAEGLVPPEVFTTRYVYDQLDRLVRATDSAGQTSRFAYDSRDNLVLRSDPEGPLTADPLGLFPGPINGPGNTCRYVHDGLSRMIRQVCDLRVGGTGAGGLDTSNPRNPDGQVSLGYVFDGNSRLVAIVDDNQNRTSFGYDALDRRVSQTNADGERFLSSYDRDGNVRSVTDPNGSVVTKSYDALNRLIQCDVLRAPGIGGTTRQTFAYDGLSRLVLATDDNGAAAAQETCEWVYDSLGRVLEERQSGRVVSSVYTGDGKRAQVTYPGGRTIARTFDAIDRIKTLSDPLGQLAESDWIGPGLRELRRVNGNGTRLTFLNDAGDQDIGYDSVQRLVRLRVLGAAGALVDREYAYNRASQRTLERRHDELGLTDTYSYDSVYRVVASAYDQAGLPGAVARDLSQISYRYDGVGNRRDVTKVTASAGTVSESYAVNVMNEYAAIGQTPRTHDDNGNLTDDGSRTLVWDAFNRLVGVARKSDGAPIAAYFYLPDGRRSRKVVYSQSNPGVVASEVRSVWDGAQEVEEQSAAGVTLATFVWSPVYVDELVEFRRQAAHPLGAGSFYAHQDARCDVVAVTDGAGQVVERRRYDDFGREEIRDAGGSVVAASPSGLEYGFQGRRKDSETGWVYFRARMYDPETGRFLSRDPVWDAGNVGGWYSFAGNGPVSGRDPSGLLAPETGVAVEAYNAIVAAAETGLAGGAVAVAGVGAAGGAVVVGVFVAYQGGQAAYYGTNEDLYFGQDVADRYYRQSDRQRAELQALRNASGDVYGARVNQTALDRVLDRLGITNPAQRQAAHDEFFKSGDIFKAEQAAKNAAAGARPGGAAPSARPSPLASKLAAYLKRRVARGGLGECEVESRKFKEAAGGEGEIWRIDPSDPRTPWVDPPGKPLDDLPWGHHEVYVSPEGLVHDPWLGADPVPRADYERQLGERMPTLPGESNPPFRFRRVE